MSSSSQELLVTDKLCDACYRIINSLPELSVDDIFTHPVIHHEDVRDVFVAARQGCYICSSLIAEWHNHNLGIGDAKYHNAETRATLLGWDGYYELRLHVVSLDHDKEERRRKFAIEDNPEVFIMIKRIDQGRSLEVHSLDGPSSTINRESLAQATSWLDRCQTTHNNCRLDENSPIWYPSRLLHISDGKLSASAYLIECGLEHPNGPYVCLSHRWASGTSATLDTKNYMAMKACIETKDLPQTFRDAIQIALDLGFEYLWVDSLCIIQDSEIDWLKEASVMHKIFENAALTISATHAEATAHGLACVRHAPLIDGLVLNNVRFKTDSNPSTVQLGWGRITHDDYWEALIMRAPMTQRAWVLQERLLSRRILHFGFSQLAWECGEVEACELYALGLESDKIRVFDDVSRRMLMEIAYPSPTLTKSAYEFDCHRLWMKIAGRYSNCGITKPSDKLIALSGLAKFFKTCNQDMYLAGLWKENLINDLFWRSGKNGVRCKDCRAPSWSWASMDSEVSVSTCLHLRAAPIAEVLHAETSLVDQHNSTGSVSGGILVLSSKLADLAVTASEEWTHDLWLPAKQEDNPESDLWRRFKGDAVRDDANCSLKAAYCLALGRGAESDLFGSDLTGLIVEYVERPPTSMHMSRTFRRLGTFWVPEEDAEEFLDHCQDAVIELI